MVSFPDEASQGIGDLGIIFVFLGLLVGDEFTDSISEHNMS